MADLMKKDSHRQERAKKLMAGCYKRGGGVHEDEAQDKKLIKKMIGKHDRGEKLKAGGHAPKKRLDKPKRYASGGGVEDAPKKSSKGGTTVNIMVEGKDTPPMMPPIPPQGAPIPPAGVTAGARPPMGGPPAGMVPPGARPPGMMKRGGAVKDKKYPIDAGAGGGEGRLQKAAAAKSTHGTGKRGG